MTRRLIVVVPLLLAALAISLMTLGRWREDAAVFLWNLDGTTRTVAVGHIGGRPFASLVSDWHAGPGQRPIFVILGGESPAISPPSPLGSGIPGRLEPHGTRFGGFVPQFTLLYDPPTVSFAGFAADRRLVNTGGGGIGGNGGPPPSTGSEAYVVIRAWALMLPLPLATLPAVPWLRRRRRRARGQCLGCGYDLHGLPAESDRCPECGRPMGVDSLPR